MHHPLRPIFLASFLFTFHLALLSYLNSSVLALHGSALQTTLVYTIASALSLFFLLIAPRIVGRVGASRFLFLSLSGSALLLWLLGVFNTQTSFIGLFVVYFSLNTVIWYAFDLVIEHYSRESITGNIRGLYLTLNNAGWVAAPMVASAIVGFSGFDDAYRFAAVVMIVAIVIIAKTTHIKKSRHVPKISLRDAFKALVAHPHARRIVTLYFILQFFFAWMVIYMAPYLLGLGFDWKTIGVIFSIMLLPFVLLQYGVGKMADREHNERTLIILGFCVTGIATLLLALPDSFVFGPSAALIAGILFLTRVGASIIEVGCESAFFKAVNEHDTALISTLRMTLPLAYIIAPLLGALVLWHGTMNHIFVILGILCFSAMGYAFRLKIR